MIRKTGWIGRKKCQLERESKGRKIRKKEGLRRMCRWEGKRSIVTKGG